LGQPHTVTEAIPSTVDSGIKMMAAAAEAVTAMRTTCPADQAGHASRTFSNTVDRLEKDLDIVKDLGFFRCNTRTNALILK
jgi:hypothetical protein